MRTKSALRKQMEALKIGGIPVIAKSAMQRNNAFNIARSLGFGIQTRRRIAPQSGFEIYRTK